MSAFFSTDELKEFSEAGYTRVPVVRELLADMETPLTAYLKLANQPYTYLFESVESAESWGRYSMIGLAAEEVVKVSGSTISCQQGEYCDNFDVEDPIDWIKGYAARFKSPELVGLPRCNGGLVGYFGYDSVRYFEPRLGEAPGRDDIGAPDILLMRSETLVVFDNWRGSVFLVVHVDPGDGAVALDSAEARLDAIQEKLRQPLPEDTLPTFDPVDMEDFDFAMPQEDHAQVVKAIRDYILAGDVMQVVPSQRMTCDYPGEPLAIYRALRHLNPSPYMYFMHLDDTFIAGSSPEILARVEQDNVTVRPLAGTRRRGRTDAEDKALEEELVNDPKEIAEHVMLIDLGRNDIGRVSQPGSVKVTEQMVVERYSQVMHLSTNVQGKLLDSAGPLDVLASTLPAGTLSGAPKVRAMEIIDEVEPVKRGIYGGTVGYMDFNGNMDMAIAIRTAVIKAGKLHLQAGGGIVADSVPALEWKETLNKGRAVFKAVNLALSGLDLTAGQSGDAS